MTGAELRRLCLRGLVVAFALAGLAGVVAVLSGGGHPAGRVVLSAAALAVYSAIALTLAEQLEARGQSIALAGLGACLFGLGLALIACWIPHPHGAVIRAEFSALVLSLMLAQTASVAGAGGDDERPAVFELVRITSYGAAAALSLLLVGAIVHDHGDPSDRYWRALGAVLIVDVVSTVILGLLARLMPGEPPATGQPPEPAPLVPVPAATPTPTPPQPAAEPAPAAPRARRSPALAARGGLYAAVGAAAILAVAVVVIVAVSIGGHDAVTGPSNAALAGQSTAQRYCVLRTGMSQAEVRRIMRGPGRPSDGLELLLFRPGDDEVQVYRSRGGELGVVFRSGTARQFAATALLPAGCPNG